MSAYVDPAAPVLDVWLLDQRASLTAPIARLAAADLGALAARHGIDLRRDRFAVTVSLAESPTLAGVVASPALAGDRVARVDLVRR